MRAHVVHESSVGVHRRGADTAEVRITLDSSVGSDRLEQRVIRFAPGRSQPQQLEGLQGILFVVSGRGTLETEGESHELEPEAGAYLRPEDHFVIDNPGPDELVTVLVTTWPPNGVLAAPDPRVVRLRERPSLPAGKDREFRYLVHRDTGSPDVTQFIGTIPPGRAPHHSHVYDEVIYVLDGRGQLHVGGADVPDRARLVHASASASRARPRERGGHADARSRRLPSVRGPRFPRVRGKRIARIGVSGHMRHLPSEEEGRMRKVLAIAALAVLAALVTAATGAGRVAYKPTAVKNAANALVRCGTTRTVGIAYPATGPAASIGVLQFHWAQFFQNRWNESTRGTRSVSSRVTRSCPNTAQALAVAQQFASNSNMLGLVGPAGSQEVQDTVSGLQGSRARGRDAARRPASRSPAASPAIPRETPANYFFRTVPNDGQQGERVAFWINKKLKRTRIYIIDDQEAYSQGLADQVQTRLRAAGKTVTRDSVNQSVSDFSSLITRIPSNTQVVYIPWQLAGKAQLFYTQLRAAGKSAVVFGSDGTFAPGTFTGRGSYVSAFPVDYNSPVLKAYRRAHGGQDEAFGLPSYTAAARERQGDHEGVQERNGHPCRGAEEHHRHQADEGGVASRLPGAVPQEEHGRAAGSGRHGSAGGLRRSTGSAPTATTTASDEVASEVTLDVRPTSVGRTRF